MNKLFIFFLVCLSINAFSQSITPAVINSSAGGGVVGSSGVEIYYNIGESMVSTINNSANAITQGFLQPEIVGDFNLSITPLFQDESCLDKNDGFISIALNTVPKNTAQFLYVWNPSSICPTQNCSSIDSLAPGNYSVTVRAISSSNVVIDSVLFNYAILPSSDACQITIYNGFTPDGDGINDNWLIDNIENFSSNTVSIFNRWGNKVWSTVNYNNSNNVWDGKTQSGLSLPSGTYFYVVEINNGSAIKKGWVELTGK
jgi:gliding motility-associated-like protein